MKQIKNVIFSLITLTFFYQCQQPLAIRRTFSVTIIDTVIQVGSDGRSGSYTKEFLWGKFQHRKFELNQDSIKVYGFDYDKTLTKLYSDSISFNEAIDFYYYLRGKRLDTLNGGYYSDLDHGMISTIYISGDSIQPVTIVDNRVFEPAITDIQLRVDKLVRNKKIRMYYD
jgi:hypothetical protein